MGQCDKAEDESDEWFYESVASDLQQPCRRIVQRTGPPGLLRKLQFATGDK